MNRLSPALTPTLLLILGGVILYLLGRWDQSIDTGWELHRAAVVQALELAKDARAREDSLRVRQLAAEARADSAALQVHLQASAIAELEAEIDRKIKISVESSIADLLLANLRMRPIGDNLYGTDSSGVRFLDSLRVASFKALLVPPLQDLVREQSRERDALREALWLANTRADSAGARAGRFEDLLREGRNFGECDLDPFGLLPCPSRGLAFVAGVTFGFTVLLLAY